MSAIRTFALAAVAAAALSGSAQAQGQPIHGHGRAEMQGHFANLNLTEAQKAQIKAIHTKYAAQLKASRAQAKPFMEAARTARQKGDTAAFRANMEKARQVSTGVRQQEMNEVRAILTPAQRAQADSLMAQHARSGGMQGMRPGAMHGMRPGAMRAGRDGKRGAFKSLNLTDAQKTQIKAIRAKYQGQAKTSRDQEMNEIRAVLTADQRTKLDSAKAQREQNGGNRGATRGQWKKGGK
jgi:Spy/CpxP family protein refolding chaperone